MCSPDNRHYPQRPLEGERRPRGLGGYNEPVPPGAPKHLDVLIEVVAFVPPLIHEQRVAGARPSAEQDIAHPGLKPQARRLLRRDVGDGRLCHR